MAIEEKVVQPESKLVAEQKPATPEPPVDAIKKQYEEQISQLKKNYLTMMINGQKNLMT